MSMEAIKLSEREKAILFRGADLYKKDLEVLAKKSKELGENKASESLIKTVTEVEAVQTKLL